MLRAAASATTLAAKATLRRRDGEIDILVRMQKIPHSKHRRRSAHTAIPELTRLRHTGVVNQTDKHDRIQSWKEFRQEIRCRKVKHMEDDSTVRIVVRENC